MRRTLLVITASLGLAAAACGADPTAQAANDPATGSTLIAGGVRSDISAAPEPSKTQASAGKETRPEETQTEETRTALSVAGTGPSKASGAPSSSGEPAPTENPVTTVTSQPGPSSGSASAPTVATTPPAPGSPETVRIRFESQVSDVTVEDLQSQALAILNDARGWIGAGFTFVSDDGGPYRVVLAEGPAVDQLCLPLKTYGTVSCQNGPVVALNADRWRDAVDHWVLGVEVYRGYLVNHEVGHLIGQRHPKPRCPAPGRPAGVMEQQTAGLEGCTGNPWPRDWELDYASQRPVVYAPLPDWGPDPVPTNRES